MKEAHLRSFRHVFSKPLISRIASKIENINYELKGEVEDLKRTGEKYKKKKKH